jgi:protein TonB
MAASHPGDGGLVKATETMRWPEASPGSRPWLPAAGCAALLHVAVCAAVLALVRLPAVPYLPDSQAMEMVFATPQVAPPMPAAPPAPVMPPAPPDRAETPAPPEPPSPPDIPAPSLEAPTPAAIIPPPAVPTPPPRPAKPVPIRSVAAPKGVGRAKPVPVTSVARPPDTPAIKPAASEALPVPGAWQRSLAAWLAAHKTYPDEARRKAVEGSVVLRFTADRSGRVLEVVLVRSAGSSILDASAEAMVRNATLPPFTAGMPQQTVTVTVQLRYALAN